MADTESYQQPTESSEVNHSMEKAQKQVIEVDVVIEETRMSSDGRKEDGSGTPPSLHDSVDRNGRNIFSRLQNYNDMPKINDHTVVIGSENLTIHKTPVNHRKGKASADLGNQPKTNDDPQPGSSSNQRDTRQLPSIDSTIYMEPEQPEENDETEVAQEYAQIKEEAGFIEETWESSKARRYRRRAIFCTDMYNNLGDMAHEKQFSEAIINIKERWNRRAKLDRKLSDLVQSKQTDTALENGDLAEENNKKEGIQRQKKLTMKDVYKELRLMRQVVTACVRTDSAVVKDREKDKILSSSEPETEKKEESDDKETKSLTDERADVSDNDTAVLASPERKATSTDENNETDAETDGQDIPGGAEQETTTEIQKLSDTDKGHNEGEDNCVNDDEDNPIKESANSCSDENTRNSCEEEVPLDTTVEELVSGEETKEVNERSESDGDTEARSQSPEGTLEDTSFIEELRDTVPSRLSDQIDLSPDNDLLSRRDSTSSLEWMSTFTNMNDVILLVDDYKGESQVGCVVYTETDSQDPAQCSIVCPADVPSVVNIYENVISNIIHIQHNQNVDDKDDEITVAIPFVKDEMYYYQEPVLRVLNSHDKWSDVPCRETLYQRDDDTNLFVVMTKFAGPTTCVVVAVPIVDDIVFTDKMTKFHSTVDNEILLTCPVSARINSKNVHVELKVLPVIPSILEETKSMFDTDRQKLYSAGAIVTLRFYDDHPQTIYMHLPCARPPVPSRPTTGSKRLSSSLGTPDSGYRSTSRGGQMSRKGSTFGKFVEPSLEKECHLVRFASCMTTKVKTLTSDDVTVEDQAIFSVHEKSSTSVVLEVTEDLPSKVIQDVVPRLLTNIEYQNVQICLAHNKKCLNELALSCDRASKVNSRQMIRLESENIIIKRVIKLKEGDTLCVCFRGNIASISNHRTIFRYYGIHGIHTAWTIDVMDRYGQRSLTSFCGFLQIFVWKSKNPFDEQCIDVDKTEFWNIVTEMPISLPKTVLKLSTKLVRAPVTLRTDGTITPEFLENLALAVGEGWLRLANSLDIDHPRIQSIKQQHKGKHQELARDILMTWFKRSLFGKEKTSALIMALRNCGRDDLADALRESSKRYRREQARTSRDIKMETVILSVCKSTQVVSRWKDIGSMLDIDESEIETITAENSDEVSKCREMLSLWKRKENGYGLRKLVKCLKHLGLGHIADHLTSMMTKPRS
ncbi:uncharacterized protein [Argopecten irradians]|uniref:uncharacterized protein n=1 Tax=Argopecten irradians TaxID=31199 RepID=UPI003716C026